MEFIVVSKVYIYKTQFTKNKNAHTMVSNALWTVFKQDGHAEVEYN